MTKEAEKKELSDEELYDLAWEDEDGDKPSAKPDAGESEDGSDEAAEKARAADTANAAKVGEEEGTAAKGNEGAPAEEKPNDDPWSTAPPELRQAYQKAQNDIKSVAGRHAAAERKAAEMEKELKRLNAEKAELTRKKGTYEQEHPELFNEVLTVVESRVKASAPAEPEAPATPEEDEGIKTVYRIHKDVGAVMSSPEWAEFVSALTPEQQALYSSNDPYEFSDLVTEFKVAKAARAAKPKASQRDELLAAAAAPSGKAASKPAARSYLTPEEAYDAEWEKDD